MYGVCDRDCVAVGRWGIRLVSGIIVGNTVEKKTLYSYYFDYRVTIFRGINPPVTGY